MKKHMTKKDHILRLRAEGWTDRHRIAAEVGCSAEHVSAAIWNAKRPGYGAKWMREHRKNPSVRRAERMQQRDYNVKRWATDPQYRARSVEQARQWRQANRDRVRACAAAWREARRDPIR